MVSSVGQSYLKLLAVVLVPLYLSYLQRNGNAGLERPCRSRILRTELAAARGLTTASCSTTNRTQTRGDDFTQPSQLARHHSSLYPHTSHHQTQHVTQMSAHPVVSPSHCRKWLLP